MTEHVEALALGLFVANLGDRRNWKRGLQLGWQGIGGDAEVIEQRAANEALDAHGLRLAAESSDEALVVVGAPADAVTVGVVRIFVGEDRVLVEFGD